ncbi:MAG: LysR family substrate-binding domain-containing protein [Sphingobium sp.]
MIRKSHISSGAQLAIGCFASICRNHLGDELLDFARQCPDVELGMHEMPRASLLPALAKGELALAILPETQWSGALPSAELWQDRVMVAAHRAHPLAQLSTIMPERLSGEVFLVSRQGHGGDMHRFLTQRILPDEPSLDTMLVDLDQGALMEAVAARRGIALICASHCDDIGPAVAMRPVRDADFAVRAYWNDDAPQGPLAALIAILTTGQMDG